MTSLNLLLGGQFRTFTDNVRVRLSEPALYHYPLNPLLYRDNPLPHHARDNGARSSADDERSNGQAENGDCTALSRRRGHIRDAFLASLRGRVPYEHGDALNSRQSTSEGSSPSNPEINGQSNEASNEDGDPGRNGLSDR